MNQWHMKCSVDVLRQRAFFLQQIRKYFEQKDVLEVQTPILSSYSSTDLQLDSFSTQAIKPENDRAFDNMLLSEAALHADVRAGKRGSFMRTSPEFFLKRLLASGVGDIYEIGQVFRRSENSKIHNPEFTMLEWYRLNFTLKDLMEEVECLLRFLLKSFGKRPIKFKYKTYQKLCQQYLEIDPFIIAIVDLNALCVEHGYTGSELTYNESLDFLFSVVIQPQLPSDEGLFVYHFPATQAALAQIHPDKKHLSLRFELLWKNIELANGYQELTCADELKERFEEDNIKRLQSNKQIMPMDVNLLAAMSSGLPACSGVAIGLDRLFMNLIGKKELSEVLGFDAGNS